MKRIWPLTLVAMATFACSSDQRPQQTATGDAHAGLACTACHQGGLADGSLAAVPSSACAASGCHTDGSPSKVTLASVSFQHRGHGSTKQPVAGCAGCHTHEKGGEPLTAGPETCGLCHADQLSGAQAEDCRVCHQTLNHEGMTSQGVAIPHQGLPWIEGGCLRCHYAVSKPVHEVSLTRCSACHDDVDAVATAGIGEDLHPAHQGNTCGSCHEEDNHRIEAMSSAVDLECSTCHSAEHDMSVDPAKVAATTCEACHKDVHQAPQRLVLGILPNAQAATPSDHFMDGLTCRSCHFSGTSTVSGRRVGSSDACVQCHRPEYAKILGWWNEGIAQRTDMVERYLQGAEAAVASRPEDDAGRQAAARGRTLLTVVEKGGGQHNLPLTHKVFEDVLLESSEAYRLAGLNAPAAPRLGRAPRQGICAYCHYRLPEPGFSERMDDAFHRDVLGATGR